jgi:hypothetical protein
MKKQRIAAILGAGVLALPLSACAGDDPDVVVDDQETETVVPEDDTGETEGDTGGETDDGSDGATEEPTEEPTE